MPTLFEASSYQPLLSSLEKITDQRMKRGVRYKLKPMLILLFLSKIGGADTPSEIADWVSFRFDELKSLLCLDWKRSPHEVTWKRILDNGVDAVEVEEIIGGYLRQLAEKAGDLLNLDGKVLSRVKSEDDNRQLYLLALQEAEENLTVEQTALSSGENEISAGRRLLEKADLEQKIVSGDAIFAQTELSRKVVEKGGDYLWKLRANQGRMYELAKEHFAKLEDRYLDRASSLEKGHGRIEQRECVTSFRLAGKLEFPYLEQVFCIVRRAEEIKTGKQTRQEIYGITSLAVERFRAAELLNLTRRHWHIENGLHYRRDVTFKEDRVRKKSPNAGQVMAALNNLAIGVLRKIGWRNIAKARRFYNAQVAKGFELIINPIVT